MRWRGTSRRRTSQNPKTLRTRPPNEAVPGDAGGQGYLHFYASEYLKVTRVSDVLHNWALMFAVNDVKPDPDTIDHRQNLRGINFYCTPAVPAVVERRTYKRNPVPEDTGAGKMGLMEIEYYLPNPPFSSTSSREMGLPHQTCSTTARRECRAGCLRIQDQAAGRLQRCHSGHTIQSRFVESRTWLIRLTTTWSQTLAMRKRCL